jgi:hypothetical protein
LAEPRSSVEKPSSASVRRFAGVAIAAAAQSTPSSSFIARLAASCITEST